jgi:transcriptional regulator with XRE-family HTH domain
MNAHPTPRKKPGNDWVNLLILWRTCYGFSQPEAAKIIKVPLKTLEKWEQRRQHPVGKNLANLRRAFIYDVPALPQEDKL